MRSRRMEEVRSRGHAYLGRYLQASKHAYKDPYKHAYKDPYSPTKIPTRVD